VNLRESLSCLRSDGSFMKFPDNAIENGIVANKRKARNRNRFLTIYLAEFVISPLV